MKNPPLGRFTPDDTCIAARTSVRSAGTCSQDKSDTFDLRLDLSRDASKLRAGDAALEGGITMDSDPESRRDAASQRVGSVHSAVTGPDE